MDSNYEQTEQLVPKYLTFRETMYVKIKKKHIVNRESKIIIFKI